MASPDVSVTKIHELIKNKPWHLAELERRVANGEGVATPAGEVPHDVLRDAVRRWHLARGEGGAGASSSSSSSGASPLPPSLAAPPTEDDGTVDGGQGGEDGAVQPGLTWSGCHDESGSGDEHQSDDAAKEGISVEDDPRADAQGAVQAAGVGDQDTMDSFVRLPYKGDGDITVQFDYIIAHWVVHLLLNPSTC